MVTATLSGIIGDTDFHQNVSILLEYFELMTLRDRTTDNERYKLPLKETSDHVATAVVSYTLEACNIRYL